MFDFLFGVQIVGIVLFVVNFLVYLFANAIGRERILDVTYVVGSIAAILVIFGTVGAIFVI